MLNKEEKRIIDSYILPAIEKFNNIYFHCDKLYEDVLEHDFMPEGDYNKKVFPYRKVMSDMWDIINGVMKHLNSIRDGDHTKPVSWENRQKRRNSERNKKDAEEDRIEKKAYQKGREMAVIHYEHMKMYSRDSENKKITKAYSKAYNEGSKAAKEMYILTNKQILRKAESLELEMKLGFKEELKKELENEEIKNDN